MVSQFKRSKRSKQAADKDLQKKPVPTTRICVIGPQQYDAVLFDMDGIVTKTATVHAKAWKSTFDAFLKERFPNQRPFDIGSDYQKYVDGKPREDGVKSFLDSRGIELPWGKDSDPPGFDTICAIGTRKNNEFHKLLSQGKLEVYETTVALIQACKHAGTKVAVITASENGESILRAANMLHVFDARVDGKDLKRRHLKGKPAPDSFLEGARRLNVDPKRAVVIEDAESGVEAGHNGGFGLVIGVDRGGHAESLKQHGADIVVQDLAEVGMPERSAVDSEMAISELSISDKNWQLTFDQFDPKLEGRRESLCSMGNGYVVSRGAAPESKVDGVHRPGTYLAGVYNRLQSTVHGQTIEHEDLVNVPNWQFLSFKIEDSDWFHLSDVSIISFSQTFSLIQGILRREISFKDKEGRETTISESRFVHMQRMHYCGIELVIQPQNWSGKITVRSGIDGDITNTGTKMYELLDRKHLQPSAHEAQNKCIYLRMCTTQSQIHIAEAASNKFLINGKEMNETPKCIDEAKFVAHEITASLSKTDTLTVQKIAAIFNSHDNAISEAGLAAKEAVLSAPGFNVLIDEQKQAWHQLWHRFELSLETEESIKMQISLIMHLHSCHVLETSSANTIDLDVGMPARGWSEGYQGHVFWDDLFVFPFLNLRMPELTQSLLKYRYRRLPEARRIAASMGLKGARFPWQSASSGREETPSHIWYPEKKEWVPDLSHNEVHVNAAIVMNIWSYYQVTGNLDFMYVYGAEMIFEIARLFASLAVFNDKRQRYEIHGVVGPDEYHVAYPDSGTPGINNNAYTNLMAVWTLCRAVELLEILPEEHSNQLCERLHISKDEVSEWDKISRQIFVPIQEDGIISQFEGFDKLQEFYLTKNGQVDQERLKEVLAKNGGVLNKYKVCKQPDVLMLFYLFSSEELKELFERCSYEFKPELIDKNIQYYACRTSNASTLSRVALTWVLSRANRAGCWPLISSISAGDSGATADKALTNDPKLRAYIHTWDVFRQALNSDYKDIQGGSTREGIHIGAMAGTIDIVQRCYTGIVTKEDTLWLNPRLPQEMTRLSFRMQYRHQTLLIEISQTSCTVTAGHASTLPIKIGFKNKKYVLKAGEHRRFALETGEEQAVPQAA